MKFYVQDPPKCDVRMIGTDPDDDLITSTVLGLEWSDITFVVLEIDERNCMCVSGSFPDGFAALYSEGGKEHVSDRPLESLDEMIALLRSYRQWDDEWRELIGWG
jgi:hypothetical protein